MKNYSQSNEQDAILNYFDGRIGTFFDGGCNDCSTLSNTRALVELGWSGVLLDASPKAIDRCKKLYEGRKNIYIYPFALGSHNGKAMLQESSSLISQEDIGLVSTFHQSEMDRFKRTVQYEPVEVKVFKWKTFLNRLKIREFTMISLDVEGTEMDILPDMDLTKTELVCIEHNSKPELKKLYLEVTSKFGLDKIIYESGENIIIVRS